MPRLGALERLAPFVLIAAATLTLSTGAPAAPQAIGGTPIQIASAPWTVYIKQVGAGVTFTCTGSIVDALHVITAAHCLYDNNGTQASITSLQIKAGVSNFNSTSPGDAEQDRGVSSLRIHPAYPETGAVTADDIAILALSAPLDLSGPAVASVPLPATGAPYPTGAEVEVAGFGRESPSAAPDGSLNLLTLDVDQQGGCGGHSNSVMPADDAVALCAIPKAGTSCSGDSGAGLVTTASPHMLVGVLDGGPAGCGNGPSTFAYTGAPEILRFVQGDDHPPTAPRSSDATTVRLSWDGALRGGTTLTCSSTGWVGTATFAYAFVNSSTGQVLQQGSKPTYVLKPGDQGDTVSCTALATNDGGTAVLSTTSSNGVGATPKLTIDALAPVAAVRGRAVTVRVVLETPDGLSGRFTVCITPPASLGARACAWHTVTEGSYGALPFNLRLKVNATARLGTSHLAITAVSAAASSQKTALVRIAGR